MDPQKRTVVIRKANQYLNDGDYENAETLFLATKYQDGLIKLADRHYKEKRFGRAYKLYKAANQQEMTEKLLDQMTNAVQELLAQDEPKETSISNTPVEATKSVKSTTERNMILGKDYMTKTKKG
jgi:hypothetical protein